MYLNTQKRIGSDYREFKFGCALSMYLESIYSLSLNSNKEATFFMIFLLSF